MYRTLRKQVCDANKKLKEYGLVILTWGNLSAADREAGVVAIKPSGVEYDTMTFRDIVVLDFDGKIVAGDCRPSSDTPTHLELYRNFPAVQSVVHTHSTYATAFAQAERPIRCLGTTHADHFDGDIPVIDELTEEQIKHDYEKNTGRAIVDSYRKHRLDPQRIPACLLPGHGPFVWGKSPENAVRNAIVLEEIARMDLLSLQCNPDCRNLSRFLLEKHDSRKHGANAYYGQ